MTDAIDIAIALCKKWEGCRLTAYPDPVSGGDPWTIGYGATGPDIHERLVWTQQQADDDLVDRIESLSHQLFPYITFTASENQLGAVLDLAYNEGAEAIIDSTLVRLMNQGDMNGAGNQFLRWDMAQGREIQGLLNRRKDERRVFFGGTP